jgi:imidazoleglycerol phosphate dehydratase HisB
MNANIIQTSARCISLKRQTRETEITLTLDLDGSGESNIDTGLGMLDHMLTTLSRHASFDLELRCRGDRQVDDHHSSEDCALLLGTALDSLLGERRGIARFGSAYAPLDEALARVVVDLSGRPWPAVDLGLKRDSVGSWACENVSHFFQSLAMTARCSLHVDVLKGDNDHHRIEAAFKALALALRIATRPTGSVAALSTKGVLS